MSFAFGPTPRRYGGRRYSTRRGGSSATGPGIPGAVLPVGAGGAPVATADPAVVTKPTNTTATGSGGGYAPAPNPDADAVYDPNSPVHAVQQKPDSIDGQSYVLWVNAQGFVVARTNPADGTVAYLQKNISAPNISAIAGIKAPPAGAPAATTPTTTTTTAAPPATPPSAPSRAGAGPAAVPPTTTTAPAAPPPPAPPKNNVNAPGSAGFFGNDGLWHPNTVGNADDRGYTGGEADANGQNGPRPKDLVITPPNGGENGGGGSSLPAALPRDVAAGAGVNGAGVNWDKVLARMDEEQLGVVMPHLVGQQTPPPGTPNAGAEGGGSYIDPFRNNPPAPSENPWEQGERDVAAGAGQHADLPSSPAAPSDTTPAAEPTPASSDLPDSPIAHYPDAYVGAQPLSEIAPAPSVAETISAVPSAYDDEGNRRRSGGEVDY